MGKKVNKEVEIRKSAGFWFWLFRGIFRPIAYIKYRFRTKVNHLKKKGPFLIICNHNTALDPGFLGIAFDFPIYYVASTQIFNMGLLSRIVSYLFSPIPKAKSQIDIYTIKKMKRVISNGGSIGLFPEGNLTYTGETAFLPESIIKLIKFLNIPVIIYHTNGLYFSNPRWSVNRKYGKTGGEIVRIISKEEINSFSDEELYVIIKDNFYNNAYSERTNPIYTGKNKAVGLERLLFICPKCHKVLTLRSEGDDIKCSNCNYEATYLENGLLDDKTNKTDIPTLEMNQRDLFINYLDTFTNGTIFEENVNLFESNSKKKIDLGLMNLSINPEAIILKNDSETNIYLYKDIISLSIQGKNKLILSIVGNKTFLIILQGISSPYKYLLTYQYYKQREHELIVDKNKLGL